MIRGSNKQQTDKTKVAGNFNVAADNYDTIAVLQKTVAERLLERLDLIRIDPKRTLDLGSGTGHSARHLELRFRKSKVLQSDFALQMLYRSRKFKRRMFSRQSFVCADAEVLPYLAEVFDLTFSNLMLQWCNNLDYVFAEVHRVTKPDGLFIFSSFGPDTLKELRNSWSDVDEDIHVNNFIDMHDVGDALIRAGFENPVMEVEYFTLTYDEVHLLFRELKNIGAGNTNTGKRQTLTGKRRLKQVIDAYEKYRIDKKIPATYEVIYGHAWRKVVGNNLVENDGVFTVPVASIKRRNGY